MRTLMPVNKRLHLSNSQMKERGSICSVLSRWWRLQPVDACLERPQTDRHIHRLDLTQQSCRKLNCVTFFFVFVFVGELSAVPRLQTTSGIEGGDTFTQREHLFSQSPESAAAACSAAFQPDICSSAASSPRDGWSIPSLRTEPYWPRQLARLRSRRSICLINAFCLKYADWSMSTKADLREVW